MADMNDKYGTRVLVRSRDGRMLAGVCAGVADYFGIDATLVRVVWAVLSIMTGGAGVLAYLAAWVIIPEDGQKNSVAQDLVGKNQDAWPG